MLGLRCLSFAYQDLEEIPYISILQHQDTLEVLDLSYNLLEHPALLGELEKLTTLILDCNNYTSHVKFPFMPSVTTVWINKNKIKNLPTFVEEVRRKNSQYDEQRSCTKLFNGGSLCQYLDYSQIPGLEVLDDKEVLEEERIEAQNVYKLQRSSVFKKKKT
ncbi:uncharacterized protein LOC117421305 isoform X2 [Acipenser ruthenus]|uniref:uncharacterized protein LOC117421305 isoform X2 n=1 Tax=Acipenser ruthenus TaxID=7906 RepID=UPI0027413B00|nr:uncharacterized protein LOC117421305 isoform X2 [Acipenser ruthenus]